MKAADFQKKYGHLAGRVVGKAAPIIGEAKPQIRIPKTPEPNKTEKAWMEYLSHQFSGSMTEAKSIVMYEPLTFRLPSGTKYTPDVVVFHPSGKKDCWEVKGAHIHNQRSIHAFKEAMAAFPCFRWGFAQKTKKNGWAITGPLTR